MENFILETEQLTKQYGSFVAVDALDFSVARGEVFGLLGPNGAGKTTTILMLLGLTEPTSGKAHVLGFDPVSQPLSVKSRVGYLPDQIGFYDELSARQNLNYIARLNAIPYKEARQRIDEALQRMGLADVANHAVATFSRGMRQRLGVAELLIKQPQVIIMDEPTLGLDPEAARQFLQMILDLKRDGITILLSSHLLHQVQAVCDRVGLFRQGRMVLQGAVPELAQRVLGGAYRIHVQAEGDGPTIARTLNQVPGLANVKQSGTNQFSMEARSDLRPDVAAAVVASGARLYALTVEMPSLDEIYSNYFQEAPHVSPN